MSKELDKIKPSHDTTMTTDLMRIFAAAGCSPPVCHACGREIEVGDIFKLVPHVFFRPKTEEGRRKMPYSVSSKMERGEATDEMCCVNCGDTELVKRDKRQVKNWVATRTGGYSRPSVRGDTPKDEVS